MTERELFKAMLPLADVFQKRKLKQIDYLTPDHVETMKSIYQKVLIVYPQSMPMMFNSGCGSCVVSALEQFISIFDRLSAKYTGLDLIEKPKLVKKGKQKDV